MGEGVRERRCWVMEWRCWVMERRCWVMEWGGRKWAGLLLLLWVREVGWGRVVVIIVIRGGG
jgi:hypothetical protein